MPMEQNNDEDADIGDIYLSYGALGMSDISNSYPQTLDTQLYDEQYNTSGLHSANPSGANSYPQNLDTQLYDEQYNTSGLQLDGARGTISYPQNLDTHLHDGQHNTSGLQSNGAGDAIYQSQSLDAQHHGWQYTSFNQSMPLVSDAINYSKSLHGQSHLPQEVSQPYDLTQNLLPKDRATLFNAAGASWAARHPGGEISNGSRSDTNMYYPVHPPTDYEDIHVSDTERPPCKRLRATHVYPSDITYGDRVTSSTMPTARSSVASKSMARSSTASKSTARSSLASTARSSTAYMPTASSPTVLPSITEGKVYECPICNMGEGDPGRKPYTRKDEATVDEHASAGTPTSVQSSSQQAKNKNSWTTPNRLQAHIVARHLNLFKQTGSSEFTCLLCGCGSVMGQSCGARFSTRDAFLEHLTKAHSKPTKKRSSFPHYCYYTSIMSFTRDLYEKLKSRAG